MKEGGGGVPGRGRRGNLDTWPTPAPGAPVRRRPHTSGSRCLGGEQSGNISMRRFNVEDVSESKVQVKRCRKWAVPV